MYIYEILGIINNKSEQDCKKLVKKLSTNYFVNYSLTDMWNNEGKALHCYVGTNNKDINKINTILEDINILTVNSYLAEDFLSPNRLFLSEVL